jgi:hypothetical protein
MATYYKAHVFPGSGGHYIMEAETTDTVVNGVRYVVRGTALHAVTDGWRATKVEAKEDAHRQVIREIGEMQAKADELADEILHERLTTEEAAA